MGIKRVRMEEIPKEMKYFGYRESKTEEIPKEMKCFGYRESKNGRNTLVLCQDLAQNKMRSSAS